MKRIILLCAASLTLSGCGIYNKYHRPEGLPTDSLYREPVSDTDTASIATLSWRELFTDPQLQALIDEALQSNTDLLAARQRIRESEATLSAARLAYLPSFMLTPQGGVSSIDGSKGSWSYTAIASASWEVDIFGRLTNAKRRARALYEQSLEYEQAVSSSLVAGVANLYYTLLMLDEQHRLSAETAQAWHESVEATRALMEAGMANEVAVAQYEANCRQVEASVIDLKEQINQVENSLSTLLGRVPGSIERGHLEGQQLDTPLLTGVPLQLLSRRPDIRAAELTLAQAFYGANAARSAFYPTIMLNGTAGWTNSAGSTILNPGRTLASAVGSLVQPLFNKGQNLAQLKIARAQQEEAELAFRQALLNAGAEVNDALVQVQNSRTRKELKLQQAQALRRALESTEALMEHTSTTYLEVLSARQGWLSARLSLVAEQVQEIQGIIRLYQALGGGRS